MGQCFSESQNVVALQHSPPPPEGEGMDHYFRPIAR